jgi:hypothetical protein
MNQQELTEVEEALQFLRSERVQKEIGHEVRFIDCGSNIYITSVRYLCRAKARYVHQLTGDEIVANAERFRAAHWRRDNFRLLCKDPWLLQCKVCGEVFEHGKDHPAPCK